MIKKNNSFISLALRIFYCNIYITLNESDEVGAKTPKSHSNISLESRGVFHRVVLGPDQEAWESGGNKIPLLNQMALGFWVPEVHVLCLSQPNLKIRENPAVPPMKSYTGPELIFLDGWQSSIFLTTTETTRAFRGQEICTEMENQPTEVRVELNRLRTTASPSISFRVHWFWTSSNSCTS